MSGETMRARPGRNDPCWCGSGRKYKKCHAVSDQGGAAAVTGQQAAKPARRRKEAKIFRTGIARSLLLGEAEREGMRNACAFNARLLDELRTHVRAGVTTNALDRVAHEYTLDHGHTPACLGYKGYPKTICTSINEVVCHGIPDERELREGDIVNVDCTTIVDGWYGDQSESFLIGDVSAQARRLVQVTFECLHRAIAALEPGCSVNEIGRAIEGHAVGNGFSVVREYQGHGIGRKFHQDPTILHYEAPDLESLRLPAGVCFTVEPMINVGTWRTVEDRADGWTVRTADGELSAQFEHTILMTEQGPEVLTRTALGPQPGHQF